MITNFHYLAQQSGLGGMGGFGGGMGSMGLSGSLGSMGSLGGGMRSSASNLAAATVTRNCAINKLDNSQIFTGYFPRTLGWDGQRGAGGRVRPRLRPHRCKREIQKVKSHLD
jgi:hypothetical protein